MESVYTAGDMDPTNNVMYLQFRVNPPAVAEGRSQAPSSKLQATVIRNLSRGAVAFDASGRRVTTAKAGVYFMAAGGERSAVSVRKVVIQR
jgi:hypothetical protein